MDEHGKINADVSVESQSRKSRLPLIALAFSLSPILLFLLTIIGYENPDIFLLRMLHWFSETVLLYSMRGVMFFVVGVIISIVALCKGKKQIGRRGLIFSVSAVLWSLFWLWVIFYIGWLMNQGRFP